MNTEKVYSICKEIQEDFIKKKTIEHLKNLVDALQQVVNNPNNANQQTNLSNRLKNLQNALNSSRVNNFSPAWKQMLEEIGGSEILGISLLNKINDTFQKNQITPASALEEIKELQKRINDFKGGIDATISGFNKLQLKSDDLEPNQSEIGFLIPRDFIDNELDNFGKEIHEITFILNSLTELVTGKKQSYKIRSVSSSDPFITISGETVAWVLAFAKIVDWLLIKYKNLLEIKKLRSELKEQGISDKDLKGVDSHANKQMKEAVNEIIEDIDKKFSKVSDNARRNELRNGLRIGLNKLVNRIDKGYNIEIRISKPDVPEKDEEKTEKDKEKFNTYNEIWNISNNMSFNKVEGESILSLPEVNQKKTSKKNDSQDTRDNSKDKEK